MAAPLLASLGYDPARPLPPRETRVGTTETTEDGPEMTATVHGAVRKSRVETGLNTASLEAG